MRAELQKLNSRLEAMSREELILSIQRLLEENAEKDARLEMNLPGQALKRISCPRILYEFSNAHIACLSCLLNRRLRKRGIGISLSLPLHKVE